MCSYASPNPNKFSHEFLHVRISMIKRKEKKSIQIHARNYDFRHETRKKGKGICTYVIMVWDTFWLL